MRLGSGLTAIVLAAGRSGPRMADPADDDLTLSTRRWIESFVVKHDLCPFAAAVRAHTRFVVCEAGPAEHEGVLGEFEAECRRLHAVDPAAPATTLVLLPQFHSFEALMELQPDVQALADTLSEVSLAGTHRHAQQGQHV